MRILTSSWFVKLPPEILRIGVSRGTPRGQPAGYRRMPELAPGSYFRTASVHDYRQLYFAGLDQLDPEKIVAKMETLSEGRDVALLCFESPTDNQYCHRAYISVWLYETLGIEVYEHGLEDRGHSWRHPKIPAQYRLPAQQPEPLHVGPYVGATAPDEQGFTWTVVGFDPEHPDQALIRSEDCGTRSISGDVLRRRFQPVM